MKKNKKRKGARKHVKLPAVNIDKVKYDGTATSLSNFIKKWQHHFEDVPDNGILPHLEDLTPPVLQDDQNRKIV